MRFGHSMLMFLAVGCGEKDIAEESPPSVDYSPCDPLDPSLCAFPFPSSLYLRTDDTTETGVRLNYPVGVFPAITNRAADPDLWNERDGFSPLTPLLVHFPNVSLDGVVGHQNLEDYLTEDAKTVLWDVDAGERIPHFVELDMRHEDDDRRALILRPVRPIPWGHQVVVGIRGLTDQTGALITASPAFADYRDVTNQSGYVQSTRREHYESLVFPTLETAGFHRDELQLAWDFVVASKQATTGKLVWMRDDALQRHADGETTYQITESTVYTLEENSHIAKQVLGTMRVPYYTEEAGPGSLLARDEDGQPMYVGERDIPFTLLIPHSVMTAETPSPILQYGHGLLGSQEEVLNEDVTQVANDYGAVLLATDWSGLCSQDLNSVSTMIVNEIDRFAIVPERSQQGFVEALMALKLVQDQIRLDPEVYSSMGHSTIDSTDAVFYGNSMGAIFGVPYVAMNPIFTKAVLGVPGSSFSLLLPRSLNFGSFYGLLQNLYPDQLETAFWLGAMQTLWDSGEPSGYMDSIALDPLPNTSPKAVLLQAGIGDAQVHTLGAHILVRGMGGGLIANPTRPVWGLDELEDGASGIGYTEWDYGMTEPIENIPPVREQNIDVHRSVREEVITQQQIKYFFDTSEMVDFCSGACISENGLSIE